MRKTISRFLLTTISALGLMFTTQEANAQCIISILNTSSDTLDVPCGAAIQLERDTLGAYALFTDFNNGSVGLGWQTTSNAALNNPCGPGSSSSSSTYLWFGNTSTAPRNLTTTPLNMSCGGQVCFELRFSIQGGSQPCEGPDLTTEGVTFEYTTNGGATWNQINYFQPNTSGSFNSQSPGSGDYTGWATYCYTLPPGASVPNVQLRWQQYASTAAGNDHWGLDSITVQTFCGGVDNIWNTGDTTQFITTNNVLTPQLYWVRRIVQPGAGATTPPDTCFDSIVVQPQLPQIPINPTFDPFCTGDDAEVIVDFGNAQFVDSNTNYNFSWFPTGVLDSSAIDYGRKDDIVSDTVVYYNIEHPLYPQCSFTDTVELNAGGVQIDSFDVVNVLCFNDANPSGEVNFYWSKNISSPISTLYQGNTLITSNFGSTNFSGLSAGSYYIAIRDSRCFDTLNFTIGASDTLELVDSNLVTEICETSPTAQIADVINGIAPFDFYWDGLQTDTLMLQSSKDTVISVYALDSVGCSTDTIDVTFTLPNPITIEQFDTTVCEGVLLPIRVNASGGTGSYDYSWNTGDSTRTIIFKTIDDGSIYSVTVSDGCMEPASMTANINYLAAPDVGITRVFTDSNNVQVTELDNDILVKGYTPFPILFQPSIKDDAYSYFWNLWNNGTSNDAQYGWPLVSNPGDVDAEFSYEKEDVYEVMLVTTTDEGCIDTTYAIHEIMFRGSPPNVFSPNGDGTNDVFYIPGTEAIRNYKLEIYNRWGRLVFETSNGSKPENGGGWDGEGHADGVYYYIASGERGNGEKYFEKGTVTIVGSGN